MKNWWVVTLGVVIGLLGSGVIWLASQNPPGNPITLLPPPTPIPIQVHITGEVQNPGVYALPIGSRVKDAIEAAGGYTENANKTALNLAATLEDGVRVQVPAKPQMEAPTPSEATTPEPEVAPSLPTTPNTEPLSQLININTADQMALETLTGIGPVTAEKIITFREENGPFSSIEEIQKVSGIGPVTFENIKDFITVGEQP
ncbi:helix-hairpin-helix domain-containing protein [Chloroflexota bacterium]